MTINTNSNKQTANNDYQFLMQQEERERILKLRDRTSTLFDETDQ